MYISGMSAHFVKVWNLSMLIPPILVPISVIGGIVIESYPNYFSQSTELTCEMRQMHAYQSGQGHASNRTDQFNCLAVVNIAVSHSKLLSFRLFIIH